MLRLKNNKTIISAEVNYDCLKALSDGFAVIKILHTRQHTPYDYTLCTYGEIENTNKLDFIAKNSVKSESIFKQILNQFDLSAKEEKSVTFNYHNELDDAYYEIKTFPLKEKNKLVVLYNDITHYQKTNNINKRLQQLMKVVSVMGEIIKNEKSIDKLLNRACDTIVNFTDSKLAWITSFNKNTTSQLSFYCSDEYVLNKHKEHVPVFPCIKLISDNKTPKVYYNPVHECSSCNLHKDYKRQSHLIFPMIFHDQIYGVLCVGLDAKDSFEQEENEMFNSLAKDLAYAIFKLETNEELETVQKKLKEYSSKIEMQNMELKQLHSELKLKDKQLLKAENKAEEFEQLKSTFLANISHEIRTPLNGILGFAQLIRSTKHSYEKINEYINIIGYSSNLLMSTIDNILDISRLRSGNLDLHINKVNIKNVFDDVSDLNNANIIKNNNVELKITINKLSKGFDVYTDESKLKQIINVLINNAYKFTKEGYVELGVQDENNKLVIYVKDTGIGIEQDKFNMIFQSFRQIDESSTREYGGVGLGLSIAKGMVHLLNGEIWLDSRVGSSKDNMTGTTFYFSIPYQTNQDQEKKDKVMDLDKIEKIDWSSKKILIVEDDDFSKEYLTEALEYTNIKFFYAKTGNEAIEKAKSIPDLDVILMDIQLPGVSGDKATQAIREFNTAIPIIAQTAHAMVNDKENYLKAGCTDYIAKPIAVNDLFSILCKYI